MAVKDTERFINMVGILELLLRVHLVTARLLRFCRFSSVYRPLDFYCGLLHMLFVYTSFGVNSRK